MIAASKVIGSSVPFLTSREAAQDGDLRRAVVAAQLLDIHGDEILILENEDSQAFKQLGQTLQLRKNGGIMVPIDDAVI